MNAKLFLCLTLGLAFTTAAQTTTNWIVGAENFRRVNGQLYNVDKSLVWEQVKGECVKVLTNAVVIQEIKIHRVYGEPILNAAERAGAYSGGGARRPLISEQRERGKTFIVTNYPVARLRSSTNQYKSSASGHVESCLKGSDGWQIETRALQVGTTEFNGERIELWDHGLPNLVPVVRTNAAKAFPLN